MHVEEDFAVPVDSEAFHHRLQAQAKQQAQELAWLLEQRLWLGETLPVCPPETLWRRLHQWMARHVPRLNLQCQPTHSPLSVLASSAPPAEDAIVVIEAEYQVQGSATESSAAKSLEKKGLP